MPEGDTVHLVARNLRAALAGHVLVRCDLRVPALATVDLSGQRVLDVIARGKHLLTRFEAGSTLHTHLRMEGAWHLYRLGARWSGGPLHQVRVVLGTEQWTAVGSRLGVVELLATADEHLAVGHLGPDLLDDDFDLAEATRRLGSDGDRPVGEAVLDQRNIAGIGNLYKAEVLFLSGVSPWRPVVEVGDLESLVVRARRLLQAELPCACAAADNVVAMVR